jgi:hypothetical protein
MGTRKRQIGGGGGGVFRNFMLDNARRSRVERSFLDVSLVSSPKTPGRVLAHRLIMAAASKVLSAAMRESAGDDDTCIIFPDFDLRAIEQFVSLFYGELTFHKLAEVDKVNVMALCRVLGLCDSEVEPEMADTDADSESLLVTYESTTYQCSTCELEFASEEQMQRHFRLHTDAVIDEKLIIECGECNCSFDRDVDFALHNHLVHKYALEFKCFQCQEVAVSEQELERHKRTSHSVTSAKSNCPKCSDENKASHGRHRCLCCSICGRSFSRTSSLKEHKLRHAGVKIQCKFCDRGFRTNSDLKKHQSRLHPDEAGLKSGYVAECPHCPRRFTDLGKGYLDHLDYHAGVKTYSCLVCRNMFSTRQALREHSMKHASKMSHKCVLCGRKFKRVQNARQHLKSAHNVTEAKQLKINVERLFLSGIDKAMTKKEGTK